MTPAELYIPTIAELERVLDEYPDIRESLRRKLLTDEERQLPRLVEQLTEQVNKLAQTVAEGFAQAADDRSAIRQEMAEGFAQAADDRSTIRQEMTEGFAQAADDRSAIRQEMTEGFAQAADDRSAIRQEMAEGFAQAADDRSTIRQEMAEGFAQAADDRSAIRQEMAEGFARAADDRSAIRQEMAEGFAQAADDRSAIRQEMTEGFARAADDRSAIRQEMAEGFAQVDERFNQMDRRFNRLEGRVDNALGSNYENKIADNINSIAGQTLDIRNVHALKRPGQAPDRNLENISYQAQDENRITRSENAALWSLDLILIGHRHPSLEMVYVAAEISITAGDADISRAAERATILRTVLENATVIPAVIAENVAPDQLNLAEMHGVSVILHPAT